MDDMIREVPSLKRVIFEAEAQATERFGVQYFTTFANALKQGPYYLGGTDFADHTDPLEWQKYPMSLSVVIMLTRATGVEPDARREPRRRRLHVRSAAGSGGMFFGHMVHESLSTDPTEEALARYDGNPELVEAVKIVLFMLPKDDGAMTKAKITAASSPSGSTRSRRTASFARFRSSTTRGARLLAARASRPSTTRSSRRASSSRAAASPRRTTR